LTIPNLLHERVLAERIKDYYETVLLKQFVQFIPAAQKALNGVYSAACSGEEENLSVRIEEFRKKLEQVLSKMPQQSDISLPLTPDDEVVQGTEDLFHSLFNYMAMSMKVFSI
jgi:hypothetical protein